MFVWTLPDIISNTWYEFKYFNKPNRGVNSLTYKNKIYAYEKLSHIIYYLDKKYLEC